MKETPTQRYIGHCLGILTNLDRRCPTVNQRTENVREIIRGARKLLKQEAAELRNELLFQQESSND